MLVAVKESVLCLGLGLRAALRPAVIGKMLGLWLMVMLAWVVVFALAFSKIQVWVLKAWHALVAGFWHGFTLLTHHEVAAQAISQAPTVTTKVFTFVLMVLLFGLLTVITVRVLTDSLVIGWVRPAILPMYPPFAPVQVGLLKQLRNTTWLRNQFGPMFTVILLTLPLMLVPVLNGALLFLLGSYLNVRGLVNDALEDILDVDAQRALIARNRLPMLVLGVGLSFLFMIPFVSLLAPAILAASVTHFCLRAHLQPHTTVK